MRKLTLNVTPRADGRVCKRIDGEYVTWPDEETARADLVEMIRRRAEGVEYRGGPKPSDPTLKMLGDLYRSARKDAVKSSTWDDYDEAIKSFLSIVGKYRRVSDLRPDDFATVRARWAKSLGVWRIDNRVQAIRTMFRWAHQTARLIATEPWYGDGFHKTSSAQKRRSKRERIEERGERIFTPDELRKILANVTGPMRTFVLLGLNGGMYPIDIAQIRKADLKRVGRLWIIDNDRGKTDVMRKLVLWPETVEAIETTRDRGESELLFLTQHGNAWVRDDINSIVMLFTGLLDGWGIKRDGVNFGAFKHTHVSAVADHPDQNARFLTRGHRIDTIEQHYDFPNLERLKRVTDLARKRLLSRESRLSCTAKRGRDAPHVRHRKQRRSIARNGCCE